MSRVVFDNEQTSCLPFWRSSTMNQFNIWARVDTAEAGGFTATACALPLDSSVLAEVRTDARESSQEANLQLVPMARSLARELTRRGDLVLAIEFPGAGAPAWEA